jgi:metal-sulfur cluster biosynthetic enzyme
MIYTGKMATKKEVIEALSQCKDPELDADIVNLGLIYGIAINGSGEVKVTLTMTSAMCPVTSLILADAQLRLESIPNIGKVELELVWDPMWSPDMMSDEIKYRT